MLLSTYYQMKQAEIQDNIDRNLLSNLYPDLSELIA